MQAILNSEFPASNLSGIVEAASDSGAGISFVLKSHSGFTRTHKGYMAVIYPGGGRRLVDMILAIHPDYHAPDILDAIRIAVFTALAIPQDTTWRLKVSPRCTIELLSDNIEDGYYEFLFK
jgi:hypothetical protein